MASPYKLVKVVEKIAGFCQMTFMVRQSRSWLCHSLKFSSDVKASSDNLFDIRILQVLVCPLSKKPLRYNEMNNELVCDEIGVAYPIVNGIPNLNPQDGRMIGITSQGGGSQPTPGIVTPPQGS